MEFIAEKRQREGIMATRRPITVNGCVEECEHIKTCYAVNYFRLNATCQLLNQTMPESKLIKATKCFYKAVRSPPQESIENDPCYKKTCPWDEICTHNKTTNSVECYPLCITPPARPGTINSTTEVEIGQNYTYICQAGLVAKAGHNPTVTCLPDGSWTSTNLTCVCTTPPARPGTINDRTELEVGQNCTYICQSGLVAKAGQNPSITCLSDGSWTSTSFTCVCTTPPVRSGTINNTTEVEVGQTYTYKCQDGLAAKAGQNPTVMCLPDGSWPSTNFTCVCTTPPAKSRTINEMSRVEIGQNYTYKCQIGLLGKGEQNPTVTCLQNGSWTSTNFICVKRNWTQDTKYLNNLYRSDIIKKVSNIDLLACMQQCDDLNDCLSFFYDIHTDLCALSSSFRKGSPLGVQSTYGWIYYTVRASPQLSVISACEPDIVTVVMASKVSLTIPQFETRSTVNLHALCDMEYGNVSLGGSYVCIKYHDTKNTFHNAKVICETEKAKMLAVTKEAEIADIKKFIGSNMGRTFIGISDESIEGNWVNVDGVAFRPFWKPNEPDGRRMQNCGAIALEYGGVFDISCEDMYSFLCNKY